MPEPLKRPWGSGLGDRVNPGEDGIYTMGTNRGEGQREGGWAEGGALALGSDITIKLLTGGGVAEHD